MTFETYQKEMPHKTKFYSSRRSTWWVLPSVYWFRSPQSSFQKNGYEYEYQRSKVYKTEEQIFGGTPQQCYLGTGVIEKYIQSFWKTKWFKKRFGEHKKAPKVRLSNRTTSAWCDISNSTLIFSSITHIPQWLILHEVAHLFGNRCLAPHGRYFCRSYLSLIKHEYGSQVYKELQDGFEANKIKYKPLDT